MWSGFRTTSCSISWFRAGFMPPDDRPALGQMGLTAARAILDWTGCRRFGGRSGGFGPAH
ncbi:hypothetical protein MPLDJ20_100128 [Mesorhizobium plurifarium]|uniref:Uncharacterized protein n=1 Tax=Mesorhizobium plurifarium TaxID=69974 RepID=A0A090DMT4_MESPL|nr:hypothetical protein MPLDJ20_100128 [Mesorhizobium plurifarium]